MHFIVCIYIYIYVSIAPKNDATIRHQDRYGRLPKPQMLAPQNSKWSLYKFALQGVNVAPSSIVHKLDRNCLGRNNEHLGLTISRVSLHKLLQTPQTLQNLRTEHSHRRSASQPLPSGQYSLYLCIAF